MKWLLAKWVDYRVVHKLICENVEKMVQNDFSCFVPSSFIFIKTSQNLLKI